MTASPHGVPVSPEVRHDTGDKFRFSADYRDEAYYLTRNGSINVGLRVDGKERYEISLLDTAFRNHKRPLTTVEPTIINLDRDELFWAVDDCRKQWGEAIASAMRSEVGPGGVGPVCRYPYEEKWENPVDEETFRAIAGTLAVAGANLFEAVFECDRGSPLDEIAQKLRNAARCGEHVLTVTAADFHLPWRMLYTHPKADEALACDGSNFDPRGFWGYRHIIEEFINGHPPDDRIFAHGGKLALGAALHNNIDREFNVACLAKHRAFAQCNRKKLSYFEWINKADATNGLKGSPFLRAVYFLCHAEVSGQGGPASLDPPILQLTDGAIKAIEMRRAINHRFGGRPPLVFINACHGGQLGNIVAHNYSFATEFLEQGVACLIGPQIEVPAAFAGEFGKCFFERLLAKRKRPPLAGVILRKLTRDMWERRNPLGLVYSLYAGADCHIKWLEETAT